MSSRVAVSDLKAAVGAARVHLLSLQRRDGHWCGELEADSVLESEYVILLHALGRSDGEDARRAAEEIRRRQRPDGAWSIYPGGPDDVSASVKAYLVLKLLGDEPDAPHMSRARRVILDAGGVEAANTYTKIYLALVGQYPWEECPAIPPEMVLLPRWFYFNLYAISSWSRGIFVPLSILWAHRPVVPVPPRAAIPELRRDDRPPPAANESRWTAFFHRVDRALKLLERRGLTPLRRRALQAAEEWILARLEESDGLGAIYPAIVNTILALRCRGYGEDHPAVRSQLEALEKLTIRAEGTLRLQPALSPVWDTAQSMVALASAGLTPDHEALERGASWLVDREIRREGDWAANGVQVEPSGWCFEYANDFYPDCDDTAEVLQALRVVETTDPGLHRRVAASRRRGLAWLLAMQNDDGGWAAFDRGCGRRKVLTHIPFADHNAMLDPSCADITGRVLKLLAAEGFDRSDEPVRRAVAFLEREQQEYGTWYGRWGCNYIYGTCFALRGLAAVGQDLTRERYRRTVRWLEEVQNADGGWGETLGTYARPSIRGRGPSTAAQTAWALLALEASGRGMSEPVRRGLDYLLRTQEDDGGWDDRWWTGTGFPDVFYLRYHYYDDYFPLLALTAWHGQAADAGIRAEPEVRTVGREDLTGELSSTIATRGT